MSVFSRSSPQGKPAPLPLTSSASIYSLASISSPSSLRSRQHTGDSVRSFHSLLSSGDSGLSSPESYLSPHPDYMLSQTYERWKIADVAAQQQFTDLRLLERCKEQLRRAKRRRILESKSPKPKHKPSLLSLSFRKKTVELTTVPSSPTSPQEDLPTVQEVEFQIDALTKRIEAKRPIVDQLDALFEQLRKALDDGRPISCLSFMSTSSEDEYSPVLNFADEYTRARKTLAARDQSYYDSKATTAAMKDACVAIQSAHHHYREAMDLVDAVCSPNKYRWEAMLGDEQSRQETYRQAAEWAHKAKICFDECVRSLSPHWELLKKDELQDCTDIQKTGLLQAVQLFNLMYGGGFLETGITQQVQVMIQKQEAMFERLTNFAVWVQNCTQECGMVELEAHEKRDAARRHIVKLWVKENVETESFALGAPEADEDAGVMV